MSRTSSSSKTQWAQPEDWAKFQNTITALFMCHSLPVVMRIMREEHKFNATPKMFQTQIYQKWGLRKTKPGAAKREAKERKRRREESEEVQSIASSQDQGRDHASITGETMSTDGTSRRSNSPPGLGSRTVPEPQPRSRVRHRSNSPTAHGPARVAIDTYRVRPSVDVTSSRLGDNEESSGPDSSVYVERTGPHPFVPHGWSNFLSKSEVRQEPELGRDAPASVDSQAENDNPSSDPSPSLTNDSGTSGNFLSTVLTASLHPTSAEPSYADAYSSTGLHNLPTRSREPPVRDAERARTKSKRARTYSNKYIMPITLVRQLEAPDALLNPEKSMFVARHYISTTFSTGAWAMSQSTDASFFDKECGKLEQWYNDFNPGFEFLREQKVTRAFRLFKHCFANTKAIIEPQDPRVVIYIIQNVIRCMYYDRLGRGLSQTLLKYITGLCNVLFDNQHPLFIILSQLSRLDPFEFAQNIRPFMDCYFDHLEPFLERSSNAFGHITEMRGLTVSLMEGTGMMGIYEAKPILDKLVRKADLLGLSSLHLRCETAAILNRNRFFTEAVPILVGLRESEEGRSSPYEWMYAGVVLMLTYRGMRDTNATINLGYELVDFLTKPLSFNLGPTEMSMSLRQYIGARQSSLLLVLGKLEKELREAGRIDEADQVQARLEGGIANEYGINYGNERYDIDPVAEVNAMV